jgi:tetratricopeptide (TPR) repeat protein
MTKRDATQRPAVSALVRGAILVALAAGCAHAPPPVPAPGGWGAYLESDIEAAAGSLVRAPDLLSRLGHASLVHDRARYTEARDLWLRLLRASAASRSPWAEAIAAFAAHRIEVSAAEQEGPSEARARDLEEVASLDLGAEARWILAGAAAAEWERLGRAEDVRRLTRARGCPARARVAVHDGRAGLAATPPGPAPGPAADVAGCVVLLRDPAGKGGVYTVSVDVESDRPRRAVLWIDAAEPFSVGGYTHDSLDAYLARRVAIGVEVPAGRSRLDVHAAANAQGGIGLALVPRDGPPGGIRFGATAEAPAALARTGGPIVPSAAPPVRGSAEPIALLLAAHERYRQGDTDGAREALARLERIAPRFAPRLALAAAVDLVDPALSPGLGRDGARAALRRALVLDPTMARAAHNLALLEAQDDRPDEATAWIDVGRTVAPRTFRFDLIEAELLLDRGWEREAKDALARAAAIAPHACDVVRFAGSLAQRIGDAAGEEAAASATRRCDASSEAWAEWLRRRGRLDEARREYERLIGMRPWNTGWRLALADVLVAAGERDRARVELERLSAEEPRAEEPRRRLADLELATWNPTRAAARVVEAARLDPSSRTWARLGHALGLVDPLLTFRVGGRDAIRAFEADTWRPGREAPAVIVLDRTVLLVEPDGSTRSLTHNVMRVSQKDGIERFGEVEVPADAEVLAVRTIKADGRALEAQVIAGKESLSAPDLQVGDYVEIEWVERADSPARYRGGFLADRFYFRSYDAPLYRTEYVVVAPAELPLQIDARGAAPAPVVTRQFGQAVRTFAMARMEQLVPEPRSAPFLDHVPSVRIGSGASWAAWQRDLRGLVKKNGRISRAAARLARATCPSADLACVEALARFAGEIENAGAPLGSAASAFAERSGSRLMLLRALLRAAGLRPELWLARPRSADVADGALPETQDFSIALLRVPVRGRVLWLDPRLRFAAAGEIAPLLDGATAFSVEPAASAADRTRIAAGRRDERRTVTLDVALRADGSADVTGDEELRGFAAAAWREALAELPADKIREEFEQRWLGFYFPGLHLDRLDVSPLAASVPPLRIRYRLWAPQVARAQGDGLRVRLGFFAAMLGREYVGVADRRLPLEVDERADTRLRARVNVPAGRRVAALPGDVALDTPFGRYRRRVRLDGSTIVVERELRIEPQRVAPSDYPAFVRFASRVDALDDEPALLQ